MTLASVAAAVLVGTTHPVALTVSPARAVFVAPASRTLQLSNLGTEQVTVDVAWRSLGRAIPPNRWLSIAPRHLVLRSGARSSLTVRAGPGASPGDHNLLVLVTGRPADRSHVAVHLRLGVRVRIRAPGRLVRHVTVLGLRVGRAKRQRTLLVSVANRGNVTEQLRRRVVVTLISHNRVISRLRFGRSRELYPAAHVVLALPYAGRASGVVTALVTVGRLQRRFRLSL